MPKPIVYLANNCGFSETNKLALQPIEQALNALGFKIWEPFKRANDIATVEIFDPMLIADKNAEDILNCDLVFAVLNGEPPDVGVFFEIGYAAALKKPRVFFRDDFRLCSDSTDIFANLMMSVGYNRDLVEFKRHCYKSVRELQDVNKYLIQFVAEFHEKQNKIACVDGSPS
jgi:nucleoside 2-deoxyribosyltransferase